MSTQTFPPLPADSPLLALRIEIPVPEQEPHVQIGEIDYTPQQSTSWSWDILNYLGSITGFQCSS